MDTKIKKTRLIKKEVIVEEILDKEINEEYIELTNMIVSIKAIDYNFLHTGLIEYTLATNDCNFQEAVMSIEDRSSCAELVEYNYNTSIQSYHYRELLRCHYMKTSREDTAI